MQTEEHVDDTHSLLDIYGCMAMSLCFPYINANFKHRSGRNILRDMSFSRGNARARTLRVHRHADLEETRLEKDKPNEKTEGVRTLVLLPCRVLNITLTVDFSQQVYTYISLLFFDSLRCYLYIHEKSVRGKDEIAGCNEA